MTAVSRLDALAERLKPAGTSRGPDHAQTAPLLAGGASSSFRRLRENAGDSREPTLGVGLSAMRAAQLRLGHVYSWDDLAAVFGFKPNYFGIAGGMPVSAQRTPSC